MVSAIRIISFAALFALFSSPAQAGCDNSTFRGHYGLSVYGTIINLPGFPIQGPVGWIGRSSADGNGHFVLDSIASYAGIPAEEPTTGTYSVEPNCRITIVVFAPPPVNASLTFRGTISEDGDYLNFLQWDPPGTTIKATAKRLTNRCSWQDLAGNYTMELKGVVVPMSSIPFPPFAVGLAAGTGEYSQVGLVNLRPPLGPDRSADHEGTISAQTTTSYNGASAEVNWSGTYRVNPDCTVDVHYLTPWPAPVDTLDITWWGVLVRHSEELRFIVRSPAAGPLVGTLIKQ